MRNHLVKFVFFLVSTLSFIFPQTIFDQAESISCRLFCLRVAQALGVSRTLFPNNIVQTIHDNLRVSAGDASQQTLAGARDTYTDETACRVIWKQEPAGHYTFWGFGTNHDDMVHGTHPHLPTLVELEQNGDRFIEYRGYADRNRSVLIKHIPGDTSEQTGSLTISVHTQAPLMLHNPQLFQVAANPNATLIPSMPYQHPGFFEQIQQAIMQNVNLRCSIDGQAGNMQYQSNPGKPVFIELGVAMCDHEKPQQAAVTSLDQKTIDFYRTYTTQNFKQEAMIHFQRYDQTTAELLLLTAYQFYQFPAYRKYLKTLPLYRTFVLGFADLMDKDKKFKDRFWYVQGFDYQRAIMWREASSGFWDLMYDQAAHVKQHIKQEQELAQQSERLLAQENDRRGALRMEQTERCMQTCNKLQLARQAWHANQKQHALRDNSAQELLTFDHDAYDESYNLFSHCSESSPDNQALADTGLEYLEQMVTAYASDDGRGYDRWNQRVIAITKTLSDSVPITRDHVLHERTITMLGTEEAWIYRVCSGNALQQQLHSELVTTLNETAELAHAYSTDPYVNNVVLLTLLASHNAQTHNLSHRYEHGFLFSDYANALLNIGKQYAHLIEQGFSALYQVAEVTTKGMVSFTDATTKGIMQGGQQALISCKQWLTEPQQALLTLAKGIDALGDLTAQALVLLCKDPVAFGDHALKLTHWLTQKIINDPAATWQEITAFVTEGHLFGLASGTFFKTMGSASYLVAGLLKNEINAAKLTAAATAANIVANPTVQKVIKPLQTIAQAGATTAIETITTGINSAKSSLNVLQPAAGTAVAEVFATYGRELPKRIVNWKHLFFPEIRARKKFADVVGYHSPQAKNTAVTILKTYPPDHHGVYTVIFEYKGYIKYSTMFPDSMNHKKLLKTIKQAYKNPTEFSLDGLGFIGKTRDGIEIQFWFQSDKTTGKIFLDSIYPKLSITDQIKTDIKVFKSLYKGNACT